MIHTFIERLWALLAIRKCNRSFALNDKQYTQIPEGYSCAMKDDTGEEELCLYRLGQHHIAHILAVPARSSWLSFYLYEQAEQEDFLVLCADRYFNNKEQRRGILLSIAPTFLSAKMLGYISSLRMTAYKSYLPIALTSRQKEELHGIMNKIESLMACDYIFRKEYIQELVMQLVHFLLKCSDTFLQQAQFMSS